MAERPEEDARDRGIMNRAPAAVLRILLLLLLALAVSAIQGELSAAQAPTTLGIDAVPTGNTARVVESVDTCVEVEVGDRFPVDVFITDAQQLRAWELRFTFDHNVVQIVGHDFNLFLGSVFPSLFEKEKPDRYFLAAAELGTPDSGSGVLARLTLEAVGPGRSPAAIVTAGYYAPRLTDVHGDHFFDGPVSQAEVAVGEPCVGPAPTPPTPDLTPTPAPSPGVATTLTAPAAAGSTEIETASTAAFAVGDLIRIDPGTPIEEDNEITGFGSLILATPLRFSHQAGAVVVKISPTPTPTPSPTPSPGADSPPAPTVTPPPVVLIALEDALPGDEDDSALLPAAPTALSDTPPLSPSGDGTGEQEPGGASGALGDTQPSTDDSGDDIEPGSRPLSADGGSAGGFPPWILGLILAAAAVVGAGGTVIAVAMRNRS